MFRTASLLSSALVVGRWPRRNLAPARRIVTCLAVGSLLLPALRGAAAEISIGPNVQISAAHAGDTHYEVLVAADPNDPQKLIVGSFLFPDENSEGSSIVYASFDGGVTWRPTLDDHRVAETSDPAVAFGANGEAYYVAAQLPDQGRGDRVMLLFRSADGGRKWEGPSVFTYSDREYITVDRTSGKYHGRLYVNGNNRIPKGVSDIVTFFSTDEGRTWTGPGKRDGFGKFTANHMGNGVIASDGTFIAVIGETGADKKPVLTATSSRDGGATLTPAVKIDELVIGGNRKGAHNNVNGQPILAIDPGSARFKDRLYVVWPDRRAGKSQIFFAMSSDLGATWSKSRAINDNAPDEATDQFMPTIAVNSDGVIGVMWYDRREHRENLGWDPRFTASLDGGATFLPSVKISERGTRFDDNLRWTALRPSSQRGGVSRQPGAVGQTIQVSLNSFLFMGGDTAGLTAGADGTFHPVWVDSRTGTPQVWTARVNVLAEKSAAIAGEPRDISDLTTLEVSQPRFDRATNILSAIGRVVNTSPQPLAGPFRVRVRKIGSALGTFTVDNADPNRDEAAEWRFADAQLAPGASSAPVILRFKLSDVQPFDDSSQRYRTSLLDLNFVILGPKS